MTYIMVLEKMGARDSFIIYIGVVDCDDNKKYTIEALI